MRSISPGSIGPFKKEKEESESIPINHLYPDFESCVKDQMRKGYDEETAHKICGKIEQQTRQARFAYKVKAEPLTLQGGRYAKVQVIDTTTSKPTDPHGVRWSVTKEGLTKALKSLLQSPLVGPPELGHESDRVMGKAVQVKINGSADAIYEITDPLAWENLQSGKWGAVSPQVLANGQTREDGSVAVDDFVFEHVAFVPEGAFPHSQVQETFEGPLENFGFAYSLSAALLHGHSSGVDRMTQDDAVMGTRNKSPSQPQVPENKRAKRGEQTMSQEEKDKRITELEEQLKKLQDELAVSKQKQEILERKEPLKTFQNELDRLKSENKDLRDWKEKIITEELQAKASDVADLRIRATLADERDRAKDVQQLKQLSAEALDRMHDDLVAIVTQLESEPVGPKARFRARRPESIVESIRAELYGYTRDEKGEVN